MGEIKVSLGDPLVNLGRFGGGFRSLAGSDPPGWVNLGVPVLSGAASVCAATLRTFSSAANWEPSGHPSLLGCPFPCRGEAEA